MSPHPTATREQWLAARLEMLQAEKELTRRSDELARRRQALPWVPVEKEYRFQTETGPTSLADLFGGRSQLLVYHFMFGPDFTAGCPSCSAIADGFDGSVAHLQNHDVAFVAVSRAPLDKLVAYRRRMGWSFPWASSLDSDFNYDFNTSFTEEQMRRHRRLQLRRPRHEHRRDARPRQLARAARRRRRRRRQDVPARGAGDERVRDAGRRSSTTPTRPTRAAWTACGACTSGWTARRWAATRPARGGAATTSTTPLRPARLPIGAPRLCYCMKRRGVIDGSSDHDSDQQQP